MAKPQLVLDMGGVLIENLTPGLWEQLAASSGQAYADLRESYKREIRHTLWTGEISLPQFWDWVLNRCVSLDLEGAGLLLQRHLVKLPAWNCLEAWSKLADLHILSNHRHEWIQPLLEPVLGCLSSVTVSSQVGCCKPHSDIYAVVSAQLQDSAPVWFVDDQATNFLEASRLGWNTLLADEQGRWISQVDELLQQMGELPGLPSPCFE